MVCVTDWAATNMQCAMRVDTQWVCNVWVRTRPKTSAAAAAGNTCEAQPDVLSQSSWTLVPQSGYSRLLSIRLLLPPLQLGRGHAPAKGVLCLQLEHGLLELTAALGAAAQCVRDRHTQCICGPAANHRQDITRWPCPMLRHICYKQQGVDRMVHTARARCLMSGGVITACSAAELCAR
jgi:hypothetical protein